LNSRCRVHFLLRIRLRDIPVTVRVFTDTPTVWSSGSKDRSLARSACQKLDHKNLNTIPFFKKHNATAEWIAVYIHQEMKKKAASLGSVTVWEGFYDAVTYQED